MAPPSAVMEKILRSLNIRNQQWTWKESSEDARISLKSTILQGERYTLSRNISKSGRSVKEFVDACKKATGADMKVDYFPTRRPGDYAEVYSDPTKINRELNWTAQRTDLLESLGVVWRWQKHHRTGYGPPLSATI